MKRLEQVPSISSSVLPAFVPSKRTRCFCCGSRIVPASLETNAPFLLPSLERVLTLPPRSIAPRLLHHLSPPFASHKVTITEEDSGEGGSGPMQISVVFTGNNRKVCGSFLFSFSFFSHTQHAQYTRTHTHTHTHTRTHLHTHTHTLYEQKEKLLLMSTFVSAFLIGVSRIGVVHACAGARGGGGL